MEGRDQGMRGGREGQKERERERGATEKEPADNPICSTELVMPKCSSTCF